jgi:starch synthase
LGLPESPRTPLVAFIGRLADQKGLDLIVEVIRRWANEMDVQWAILGTGEPFYHDVLGELSRHHPQRVALRLEFSDPLAHRIEAGADIFLMPSRYEPCGLNQLYSLKYGTVPVVRATGGLVDTVCDASLENISQRRATGYQFEPYHSGALDASLRHAVEAYWQNQPLWQQLVETGMRQDWSWGASAARYVDTYTQAGQRHRDERERLKHQR